MELTLQLPQGPQRVAVTGPAERNLKIIRESLDVRITAREASLKLSGESRAVGQAAYVLELITDAAQAGRPINREKLLQMIVEVNTRTDAISALERISPAAAQAAEHPQAERFSEAGQLPGAFPGAGGPRDYFDVYLPGKRIKPATAGQKQYVHAIQQHDLTFCTGPAGTGKTYLAVAAAVDMLKRGETRKLVLTRPAVEAGEKLGFLPGTMQEKVNPYLRPLLDALHDMMEFDHIQRFMASDLIEIVPLAFMRGRTLNDAMIILDEAQNTTRSQMLMFLTRLGHGSKMVVTGDTSQTDLEKPNDSGLLDALHRLRHTRGVAMAALAGVDIVRHNLVQRIVDAYGEQKS